MTDTAMAMFQNGCSYSKAALVLNNLALGKQSSASTRDLTMPSAVNAALALELSFKTLYFLQQGKDFKVKGRHSHDFYALYCELDAQRRKRLDDSFAQRLSERSMLDVEKMERVSSLVIPRDLSGNLKSWKDVFVSCRYIHEPPGIGITTFFFPEIQDSACDEILALRPDFAPLYSRI